MFKSILANEMTAYLELREMSVSEGLVAHDRRTLVTLDCHLISSGFCSKEFDGGCPWIMDFHFIW